MGTCRVGGSVSLTHSGGYTIYYEGPGAATGNFPAFHVNVAPASAGAAVGSLTRYGSAVTYDFGWHDGRAVLARQAFHAPPARLCICGPVRPLILTGSRPTSLSAAPLGVRIACHVRPFHLAATWPIAIQNRSLRQDTPTGRCRDSPGTPRCSMP
jgi:hypothetical protein